MTNGDLAAVLTIHERDVRAIARARLRAAPLSRIVLRQMRYELSTRLLRRLNFRQRDNAKALRAYAAMAVEDFEGINARQQWANWRTIPRNLNGHVPNRPLRALDLCCGTGQSTEVLAHYLPAGSRILGLEFNAGFVERARGRGYLNKHGLPAAVVFNAQSVLETFRDPSGRGLGPRSVDLVNCSGAVGCHFDSFATTLLVREVARVLRPGAIAMLDSGPAGATPSVLTAIGQNAGLARIHASRSCLVDSYTQIVFQKMI